MTSKELLTCEKNSVSVSEKSVSISGACTSEMFCSLVSNRSVTVSCMCRNVILCHMMPCDVM